VRGVALGRRLRLLLATACVVGLSLASAVPAAAASVTFGTPTATSVFGEGITFRQPYSGGGSFEEVDIVITYPGSIGPSLVKLDSPGPGAFSYDIVTSEGQLAANTKLSAHFRVVFADGSLQEGPQVEVTYADTRFKWKTKTGPVVRLHWYEGSESFANTLLGFAQEGVDDATAFMGAGHQAPIDFFVYADERPFYDAMGAGIRENVGGLAIPETRTLFALAGPGETAYAQSAVPHEITHVVFDEVTSNPYHYPPHWLNEAIATYVSEGYGSSDRARVSSAAQSGTLMPLAALGGQFPTSRDRFFLAYAESVSAIDFFIKTYGQSAVNDLLEAFGDGASDDEAFIEATGEDMAAFDRAWMESVGAQPGRSFGPQPAPTGPLPPGWIADDGTVASAPPSSAPASPEPGSTQEPSGESDGSSGWLVPLIVIALVGAGVAVGAAWALMMRRDRPAPPV
jgi:hypothetical protein